MPLVALVRRTGFVQSLPPPTPPTRFCRRGADTLEMGKVKYDSLMHTSAVVRTYYRPLWLGCSTTVGVPFNVCLWVSLTVHAALLRCPIERQHIYLLTLTISSLLPPREVFAVLPPWCEGFTTRCSSAAVASFWQQHYIC